jgi:serine/threonine protein kinase/formylglycine-generating enzyme required for sulfatase activity
MGMEKQLWEQIESIFHAALESPLEGRPEIIRKLTGGDPNLTAEVESLLRAFQDEDTWLTPETERQLRETLQAALDAAQESSHSVASLPLDPHPLRPEAAATGKPSHRRDSSKNGAMLEIDVTCPALPNPYRDRFEVQRLLGRGGMGIVFLAVDRAMHREVALKFLTSPEGRRHPAGRVLEESRAIASLRSDHVVGIYEVLEDPTCSCLVMEYVRGPSVKRLLKRGRPLPHRFAAQVARHVALGLAEAHARGQLHGDIKPSNLLLQPKQGESIPWRAKIIDFGLAQPLGSDTAQANRGHAFGTPMYMSPERLLRNGPVDERSDVYSLGVTLYQMLVGEPPFRGTPTMLIQQMQTMEPRSPSDLGRSVPKDLESICMKSISMAPSGRYASALSFAQDLQRFLDGEPTMARPLSRTTQIVRWAKKNRALAFVSSIALLLATTVFVGAVVSAYWLREQNRQVLAHQKRVDQALLNRIAHSPPGFISEAVAQIQEQMENPLDALRALRLQETDRQAQLNLTCALAMLGAPLQSEIVASIEQIPTQPGQFRTLLRAMAAQPDSSLAAIDERMTTSLSNLARVKLALLAFWLGDRSHAEAIHNDPTHAELRNLWIHTLPDWHADLGELARRLDREPQDGVVSGVLLGLGGLESAVMPTGTAGEWEPKLMQWSLQAETAGVRNAASWLLQRWVDSSDTGLERGRPRGEPPVRGFEMVHLPAGEFVMGNDDPSLQYAGRTAHPVRITRGFFIADREVSVRDFRAFYADSEVHGLLEDASGTWEPDPVISPTPDHPAQRVTWYEAIQYCNWLSRREGRQPCYVLRGESKLHVDEGDDRAFAFWVRDPEANGYRLPSEAEFEYACRAGTQTSYFFGEDRRYLESYIAWSNNTRVPARASGVSMPNPWGLFDMLGNVWEWTDDWYRDFPESQEVDPRSVVPSPGGMVFRGGGICTFSGDPVSSSRGSAWPDIRFRNVGLRVARNE